MPSSKSTRSRGTKTLLGLLPGRVRDTIKMPGKSNKFDYTNRSNSGAKLGEIIAGSLQRELEKAKKDAEKAAARARKQSSSSSSVGGDGVSEQSSSTHTIDLKAPSKDLGDDGVCAMADGMEDVLRSGTAAGSLALEDLNLAGNGLTVVSLARLASIIKLAKYDLKTINLAGNKIEVVSDEQARQWETFLLAFKDCMKLRRLDLSDNERLGSRALESFARVHGNEMQVTPNRPMGNASVLSLVSEDGEDEEDGSKQVDSVTGGDEDDADEGFGRLAHGGFLMRRCGLRSIPYITLHNIGLSDAGALWLSYVLEDHYYPIQLISELNATNAESIIKAYQQNKHSRGVDWSENNLVGKEGLQLLKKMETIREYTLHDDLAGNADLLDVDDDDATDTELPHGRRGSTDKLHPRAKPGQRRTSIRSIRTADGGEHETTELESARKKIMRHIIGHDGKASVELWRSSIAVFWSSRLILYLAPTIRTHHTGEPLFPKDFPAPSTVQSPSPIDAPAQDSGSVLRVDTKKTKEAAQSTRASYASKLLAGTGAPGEPELAITEVTNTPTTPLRLQRPSHRKDAFSQGSDFEGVTTQLNALIVRDNSPLRFVKFQQRRIDAKAAEGKIFRDRRTPTHLPADVVEYLVRFVVSGRDLEICGGEQMRRAVERGQNKATLQAERDWLKKDVSAQVLMLLDSIKCLHYGQ